MFWSVLLALFALIAAVAPVDWAVGDGGLVGMERPAGPFSERVAEVDRALHNGESVTIPAERLPKLRRLLQTRRLSRAGGMSQNDLRRAKGMLKEMALQMQRESSPDSKQAVRQLWYGRIAEAFPRLDREAMEGELERLRGQIAEHLKTERRHEAP